MNGATITKFRKQNDEDSLDEMLARDFLSQLLLEESNDLLL
jgi:hypothetical protein